MIFKENEGVIVNMLNGASRRAVGVALAIAMCVGFASACKTNNSWKSEPVEVELDETKFDMELTAFDVEKAVKWSEASKAGQEIIFKGGFVYSYSFHRGYVYVATNADIRKKIAGLYKDQSYDNTYTISNATMPIGKIMYAGILGPKKSCFYFQGYEGLDVVVRGKLASQSTLEGLYCEPGRVEDIESVGLREFRKITYRDFY